MNEWAEPYREEANGIATRLLDRERLAAREPVDLDVREGLYIGDVEADARQFSYEAETLRMVGLKFPAIRAAGNRNVPVALQSLSLFPQVEGFWLRPPKHPFHIEYLYDLVKAWEETPSGSRTTLSVDAAVENFRTGLVEFLATRVASVVEFFGRSVHRQGVSTVSLILPRTLLGAVKVKTVGFMVDVNAANTGLRIHVSPTFRRSWRVFGMPTNPVVNTLTGGIYEFGADGGPYGTSTITPDSGTFDIPYQTVSPKLTI